jgi:hypothetical protein
VHSLQIMVEAMHWIWLCCKTRKPMLAISLHTSSMWLV